MGTQFQATVCPLCHDTFEDPADYRDHLAMIHDLVDDDGTETTLEEAELDAEVSAEAEPAFEPLGPEPVLVVSTPHLAPETAAALTGPVAVRVDRRVLPGLVIAVAVQLVLALLGLAVVGGDSPDENVAAATASSERARSIAPGAAPTTTAAPAIDTRNDQARADAIAPRPSDFPAGWQQVDPDDGGSSDDGGAEECTVEGDPTMDSDIAGTDVVFDHEASSVFASAMILKSEADALRAVSVLREQLNCIGAAIAQGAGEEIRGAEVTHGSFSSLGFPTYGDDSVASSMPMSINAGGGAAVPLRIDILAVRRDRAVVFVLAVIAANDFTPQQERAAMSAFADRMRPAAI